MKFAVVTTLSSLALIEAACQDDLTRVLSPVGTAMFMGTSIQQTCDSTATIKSDIEGILQSSDCDPSLHSPLKVLGEVVCLKDPDSDRYCFDDFSKLIPSEALVGLYTGGNFDLKFMDSFNAETLAKVCENAYCARKYKELAIKIATDLPDGEAKDVAYGYAKDLAVACTETPEEPGTWCAEEFQKIDWEIITNALSDPVLLAEKLCSPCMKAAISQRLVFADYSNVCDGTNHFICDKADIIQQLQGYTLADLNNLCSSPTDAKLKIRNAYTFALDITGGATIDEIKNALLSDMVFNLHETDLSKFKFDQDDSTDAVKLEYEATFDRAATNGAGCSEFLYPTLESKLKNGTVTADCSVSYPDGYTPPQPAEETSLTGAAAVTTTSAASLIVAAVASVFF